MIQVMIYTSKYSYTDRRPPTQSFQRSLCTAFDQIYENSEHLEVLTRGERAREVGEIGNIH